MGILLGEAPSGTSNSADVRMLSNLRFAQHIAGVVTSIAVTPKRRIREVPGNHRNRAIPQPHMVQSPYILSNKSKMSQKLTLLLTATLIVTATAGIACFFIAQHRPAARSTLEKNDRPSFRLDASKAPGWWSAGTVYPADGITKDYVGDPADLPTASLTIHQTADSHSTSCFVSYSYYQGSPIDIDAKINTKEQQSTQHSTTLSLEKTGTYTLQVALDDSKNDIALHQYNLSGAYAGELLRGIEFGYTNIATGYIEIQGNCAQADQLDTTHAAIEAVTFDTSKSSTEST